MAFIFPDSFDPQPTLQGEGLCIRPMVEEDRAALTQAASDPMIWAGHPVRNRNEPAVFDPYFSMMLGTGSALVVRDSAGRTIGCTVYYADTNAPSRLSIGFTFLVRDHWGGNTNRILKRLTLTHLFKTSSEAWFHIAPDNIRSKTATARLGAVFAHEAVIDLAGSAQPWACYCLTRENWATNEVAAQAP